MNSKIKKIKEYCKSNGLKLTAKKIYRYIVFNTKVKLNTKENTIYKLTKKENNIINRKNKNTVYMFVNEPYYCVSQKSKMVKIANTFNNMGYMVRYFYKSDLKATQKILLPLLEHKKIAEINIEEFKKNIKPEDVFLFEERSEEFFNFDNIADDKNCKKFYIDDKEIEDYYMYCSELVSSFYESEICNNEFYNNISIIILNYNNKNVIENCIDSIIKFNSRYNVEIIVVDNQSTDGSYELIKDKYKDKIKLYKNSKNGCSSGRNLGVKNSEKKYIMFLDSDQWILHKYWLEPYIEILIRDSNIGALGWAAGWFNGDGYAYNVVDSFPYKYMPPMGLYRSDIGYLGTCGIIMKRELFNTIEGFDLYYDPTCYEDTDLSLKIRNSGLEIAYTTYLGVGHLPHQTTKSGSKEHDKLIKDKGDYFVAKWKKINPNLLKYKK